MDCYHCPQCGEDTEQLFEGYCRECCAENQQRLDEHNAQYDRWQEMSDGDRDRAIRQAAHNYS